MNKRKRTSFTLKCKAKEAPKLKKFRADVLSFSSKSDNDICATSESHRNPIPWLKSEHTLTRKQNRKDARKLKKARRRAYLSGKPIPSMEDWQNAKIEATQMKEKKNSLKKLKAKKKKQRQKLKEKQKSKKEEKIDARKQMMLEEIAKEDKMLKQLEKNLHLNKRKSKSLPQSFVNDGLDYLLDVLDDPGDKDEESDLDDKTEGSDDSEKEYIDDDTEKDEHEGEEDGDEDMDEEDDIDEYEEDDHDEDNWGDDLDEDDEDIEEENEEQVQNITVISHKTNDTKSILTKTDKKVNSKKNQGEKKRVSFDTCSDNEEYDNDVIKTKSKKTSKMLLQEDDVNDEINESDDLSDETSNDENVVVEDVQEEFMEDIYGRLRDKSGNIVTKEEKSAKYIPPGKRLQISDEKKKFQVERLRKQLKGLVNRASEANMSPICSQIEAVYRGNSRAEVTESLAAIIIEACVSVTMTPERLAMEMMMLVAILHGNVGSEVGALFLQSLAQKYKSVRNHGNHMENKTLDNIIMLFAYLYVFKVIDGTLLFGIIDDLVKTFQEKDIQIVLLILKNVGFNLRKDNPAQLKDTIMNIQSAAKAVSHDQSSHVKYMLEIILAIKNNNMRKIPNYDPEHQEHLKKVTRGILRGTTLGASQLRIGLNDLIEAEHRGRWWLVGSAWEGPTDEAKPVEIESVVGDMSSKVLEMARKQRMNTDVRRNIFCVIISSQDYVDAFEKLLRLGLKNQQEREIIHIIVDLCLQEKKYNPFYAYLLQKFCIYHRRFQMSVQFLMWDKFKEMKKLSQLQRQHMAKLLSHLLSTKAMSLSVLKVVEFGTLDVCMLRFLKQLMQSVLVDYSEDVTTAVFQRIAPLSKLNLLHEGLKLFMQHFLLSKKSKDVTDSPLLRDRISIAEKILTSSSKDTSL